VQVVALADGRSIAVKVDDGAHRARGVAVAAALLRLGVDHDVVREQASVPLLGGGDPVGEVRPVDPS
jgi:L-asparaginase II